MRKYISIVVLIVCLVLASAAKTPALDINSYPAGSSASGIAGTRHNLGFYGPILKTVDPNGIGFLPAGAGGTTEICVFCHTPHHGGSDAPMWNRTNSGTYTAYGTTTAGTVIENVGGGTLACLSCHDGVTQFDVLINAPGKGNSGLNTTAATDMNWIFMMPNGATNISIPLDHFSSPACVGCHVALSGFNPADRLTVGEDLTNDHPVSVVYDENVASLRPVNTVLANIDLTSGLTATGSGSTNLQQNRWAVSGYIDNGTATIKSLLRNGRVECTSCHDPHFKNLSWDEVEGTWDENWCSGDPDLCPDGLFLRRVGGNSGSALCRTCHNK